MEIIGLAAAEERPGSELYADLPSSERGRARGFANDRSWAVDSANRHNILRERQAIRSTERFDPGRHVGNSRNPVRRVAALKNPNAAVWSRPLLIDLCTERLFTGEPLRTNLGRQHSLRRFGRNLLRSQLGAEKNGNDSQD
jgi:hypothetical protein